MDSYKSGDITLENITIVSDRANLDISKIFLNASIYESIFTPGTVCDIVVLDTEDLLGTFKIVGDEMVYFNYTIPGTVRGDFVFALNELAELEFTGAQKGKKYTLKCVSEEARFGKKEFMRSYNQLCSEVADDVHKNYLKSEKPLVVEATKGPQKILIDNKPVYEAINLVRKRAVSAENKTSIYVYFENRQNEQQTFNFVSIEGLFQGSSVKKFQQSALNIDYASREDDNIIAYKIPNQFKSLENIEHGGPRRITTFNFATWDFSNEVIKTNPDDYKNGGEGTNITSSFKNKYHDEKTAKQSFIPIDFAQRPVTNIPEATPDTQAYLAALMQNAMRIKVPGDTLLTAGQIITCEIPNKKGLTGPSEEDPLMTGKFLISRIHHKIGEFGERPRYTCTIECIKGAYEESI